MNFVLGGISIVIGYSVFFWFYNKCWGKTDNSLSALPHFCKRKIKRWIAISVRKWDTRGN